jgi:glucosamine--fructose-6-phosphate aminotransferase (isomerizing)
MCGIIGCVGRGEETLETLVHGLSKLEYRGYDSAGVAMVADRVSMCKTSGRIAELRASLANTSLSGSLGIGHTRWSTHGPPTADNAHPHQDCHGDVAVVHNGIIENYQSLRDELVAAGHAFTSDTDTEVIPHLIEAELKAGVSPEAAIRSAIRQVDGSYAVAVVIAGTESVFVARHDSPLVLGVDDDATFVASDVPAFRDFTDRVVYLDDGEFARLDSDGWTVTTTSGLPVEKDVDTVDWDSDETGKSGYDHYMLKEINEQPRALRQCHRERIDEMTNTVELGDLSDLSPTGVQFVACGTSYHAAHYGAQIFRDAGIPAQAFLASEYATSKPSTGNALVVGVTQSGETADTLSALRVADNRGARTLVVTNTVGSTAAREADHSFYIRAGPEIGVAATKTFSSQLAALNLLQLGITTTDGTQTILTALRDLPADLQQILDESNAAEIAANYHDAAAYFFVGRGLQYPVALEGALKMKEITYKHAEGFAAGELKHGPLALVTDDTPVFAVVVGDNEEARKTVSNIKEVKARNGPVVAITDGQTDVDRYADHVLDIPHGHPRAAAVLANAQLQLVAYHTAAILERNIDKPRNLAKSVTVE